MAKVKTTVHHVIDEIINGILRGRYVPEQRLVTTEFAERMGTSLSPVREAFHVLAGEGVIEIIPNRGARIRRLSIDDMISGFEILSVIGPLAIRKFAPMFTNTQAQKNMRVHWSAIQAAVKERNAANLFAAVAKSHRYVNSLSNNPYLDATMDRLHLETFYRQVAEYIPGGHWDRFLENYKRAFQSIKTRNSKQAERELARHYEWCITLLEKEKAREL